MALLGWWRATTRTGRRNRVRQRVASAGERDADRLLEEAGFELVDEQVVVEWPMEVDGQICWVSNRCDKVVRRDGLFYVAEVKTGSVAPNPTHPATRRQLLEYLLTHEADGALLVDVPAGQVLEIRFPELP